MVITAVVVWIVGLITLVPYVTWYVLFQASREQYAILITFVLFWVFGYWGVVGPLMAIVKVRRVFRTLERVKTRDELLETLRSPDARDVAIDLIATENHIPRFLAERVYNMLVSRLSVVDATRASKRVS